MNFDQIWFIVLLKDSSQNAESMNPGMALALFTKIYIFGIILNQKKKDAH